MPVLNLLHDPGRSDDPADQDRGQEGDKGHHEAVADIVHQVQDLGYTAVGQGDLHIKDAVAQGDDDRSGSVDNGQQDSGPPAARVEDLHAVGHNGLQDRHAAGQRRESRHQEKQQAHDKTEAGHSVEDLGQGDKHEAGPRLHALDPLEDENGGDDHHTRQQGHARIEVFDLVDGGIDIDILIDIGSIGDHDAHGNTQGKEDLAHGIEQDLHEAPGCHPGQVGLEIDRQPLQARPRHARRVRIFQREREYGDGNDHDQEDRHQDPGVLFNPFFHAVKNDPGSQKHKDDRVHGCLQRRCDKGGKIGVHRGLISLAGQIDDDISGDPASDDRVIGHDQDRDQKGDDPQKTPAGPHLPVGIDRVHPGPAADRYVGGQQGKAERERQNQVDQDKEAASVLGRQIGEPPQVSDTDRASGRRHDKTDLSCKAPFLSPVMPVFSALTALSHLSARLPIALLMLFLYPVGTGLVSTVPHICTFFGIVC